MKKLIFIFLLALTLISLPIIVFLGVGRRQEFRGRAAPATTMKLEPAAATKGVGETFDSNVIIDTGGNQVVSADIILNFNPQILEAVSLTSGGFLPEATEIQKTIDNTNGKVIYSLFTLSSNARSGVGTLLTISFRGKIIGSSNASFDPQTAVYGLGEGQNVLTGTTPATYTIAAAPTATPTPTGQPEVTPTPTPTALLGYVDIYPEEINTTVGAKPINLSTLAYDIYRRPIWSGVTYEWGISSASSIGSLSPITGNITNFTPLNPGTGDIFVIARQGDSFVVGGITAKVGLTPTANKVSWKTTHASLEADNFYIIANGKTYLANTGDIRLTSDPPDPPSDNYTTLEAIWHEQGVEMRLFIYFYKDNMSWWSNELRTYNGQPQSDWIYYYGRFFESNLGKTFATDRLELNSSPDNQFQGKIYFENLRLQAFLNPQPTITQVPCPTKSRGDANCDGLIDAGDYIIWQKEYTGVLTSKLADFFPDGKITLIDFEIWRRNSSSIATSEE